MKQELAKLNETANLELPMNTEGKHDDDSHDVVNEDDVVDVDDVVDEDDEDQMYFMPSVVITSVNKGIWYRNVVMMMIVECFFFYSIFQN